MKIKLENFLSFSRKAIFRLRKLGSRLSFWRLDYKQFFVIVRYCIRHPQKFWNALSDQTRKWTLRSLIFLLVILIAVPASFWLTSQKTEAAWWNDMWMYRKSIAVTNNTTAENNVYISATIDTSDTSRFQADCGDLRFTRLNGDLLDYIIVSGCGSVSTVVNVNFDVFPAGAQTIYYYYGNPSAPNGFLATAFSNLASNYTVGSIGSEEKSAGPLAYWAFDEGQGTTAQDATANDKDGTFLSAPVWKTEENCVAGKCLAFDNVDDGVSIDNQNFTSLTDYTMCSWVNPKGNHKNYTGTIMSSGNWNVSHWAFGINQSNTYLETRQADGVHSPTWAYTFPLSRWSYACLTRSGTTITAYVDGKAIGSPYSGSAGNINSSATNTTIGRETYAGGYFAFNGWIDEPKIYNYARSAAQIKMDYNAGIAGVGGSEGSTVSLGGKSAKWLVDGLVGHWKMDEVSWGSVVDSSGMGNNGTAFGSATVAAGKFGNAGVFDGGGDGVNLGSPASLDFGNNGAFTFSGWVKPSVLVDYAAFVGKDTAGRTPPYSYMTTFMTDGRLSAYNNSAWLDVCPAGSVANGNWYHIAFDYDGTNLKGYVNGSVCGSVAFSYPDNAAYEVTIGSWYSGSTSYDFNGYMDDVRIYNRSLSPQEIRDLYNYAPGPIAEWKLDENTGATGYDTSGNSRNLSFGNTPNWTQGKLGAALNFDRTDYAYQDWPDFTLGNQTIEFWIKADSLTGGWEDLVGTYLGTDINRFHFNTGSSAIVWYNVHGSCGTLNSGVTPTVGQWYHVTGTVDGTTAKIYINGEQKNTMACSGSHTTTGVYLAGPSGETFDGQIDDVKIYNYARTSDQIKEDMLGRDGSSVSDKSAAGYWKFDEGHDGTANNSGSGGSAINGTISGATWSNDGKFGKALYFDGVNSYAEVPNSASLNPTDKISLSAWIKPISSGMGQYAVVMAKPIGGWVSGGYGLTRDASTDNLMFWVNIYTNKITIPFSYDEWQYVVATYDGSTMKIFKNGLLVDSKSYSTAITQGSEVLRIGKPITYDYPFKGSIDEVKIYNYALTADEIASDYNQGKSMSLGSASTLSDDLYGNWTYYQDPARADVLDASIHHVLLKSSSWCGSFPATIGKAGKYQLFFEYKGSGTLYIDNDGVNDNIWNANMEAATDWKTYSATNNFTTTGSHSMYFRTSGSNIEIRHLKIRDISTSSNSADRAYCPPGDATGTCGPIGEWKFEEGSGASASDTSGNNHNGTATGTTIVSGKFGKARDCDGSFNSYVTVPDSAAFSFAGDFSISIWAKPRSVSAGGSGWDAILGTYNGGYGYILTSSYGTNGNVAMWNQVQGWIDTGVALDLNVWNHLYVTRSSGTISVYKNGMLSSVIGSWGGAFDGGDLTIGRWYPNTYNAFNGVLDEVRIYSYARSAAQVAWDYNRGGPFIWWKMDEGEGTTAHDSAGNNNNGTLSGGMDPATDWITGKINKALDLDGSDDYVSKTGAPTYYYNFSLSVWIKPDSVAAGYILGATDIFTRFGENCAAGKINVGNNFSDGWDELCTNTTLATGNWYHVVYTYDGSSQKIYVNGVLDNSESSSGTGSATGLVAGTTPWSLGTTSFDGQMDDVRAYNYALTAQQVKDVYSGGAVNFK